jgi:hypothetical protein
MTGEIAPHDHPNFSNLDYRRYQTDKLRSVIEEILSVTGNFAFFMRTLFLVWIIGPVIMPLLFADSETWAKALWSLYGAFSFFFIALGFGIFMTKRRMLRNMVSIVDVLFEACDTVLNDIGDMKNRGVEITAVTLVSRVNATVIQPVVEGVLRSKLGFLSTPLLRIYQSTFKKIIQAIETTLTKIAKEEDQRIAADDAGRRKTDDESTTLIQRAENATLRLKDSMKRARESSILTASKIIQFAVIPSFSLAAILLFIAFIPVLLAKIQD